MDEPTAERLVLDAIASGRWPGLRGVTPTSVRWVGVNERRIDARLRGDGDGRDSGVDEWHVVVLVDGDGEVVAADSFPRPRPVPAGTGVLVVLNGPSGAGKSSVLDVLVARPGERPWIVFDEPVAGRVAQPHLIWPEASPHVHAGFLAAIAAVAASGNLVATAAAGHPQAAFAGAAGAAGVRLVSVGLHCSLEELLARERGREGRWGGLAASSTGAHAGWHYDLELDSSTTAPADLATLVVDLV